MTRLPIARGPSPSVAALDPQKMSVKQLAQTVRYGRKVTFLVFDAEPVCGYLAGMDEGYFYVLSPNHDGYDRWIISRAGSPAFQLHGESTYEFEAQREQMEKIIGPFRGWIANHILGSGRSDTDARKAG